MREILFRGKTTEGKWVQGSLQIGYGWRIIEGKRQIDHRICDLNNKCDNVIPETVGQYTGLTDKNGERIFEGDIVEGLDFTAEDGGYGVVTFDEGAFEVVGSCDNNIVGTFHENYYGKDFEVIGNIHDNPELLKGGEYYEM